MSTDRAMLTTAEEIRRFALGGKATLTLHNPARNTHVTLKLSRAKRAGANGSRPVFVRALRGTEVHGKDYGYAGIIWENDMQGRPQEPSFRWGGQKARAAGLGSDDPRVLGANWLCRVIRGEADLGDVQIWHEGQCCFCGRALTQPESVRLGYGPDCAKDRGLPYGTMSHLATPASSTASPCEPKADAPSSVTVVSAPSLVKALEGAARPEDAYEFEALPVDEDGGGYGEDVEVPAAPRRTPEAIECPHCRAGEGEACVGPKGSKRPPHLQRVQAIL